MLIIINNNRELVSDWISKDSDSAKMFGVSKKEKATLTLLKKLGILVFLIFVIFFFTQVASIA